MMLAQSSTTIFSPSNMKLFLYGSIVVIMIVARIMKAAKEAAEKKRIQDSIKQAELEALRTGRPIPMVMQNTPSPELSAAERLEELARKRNQEVQAARSRASVATTPKPQPRVVATPTPPMRQPRPQQPVRKASVATPQKRKPVVESQHAVDPGESTTHRLVPDSKPIAPAPQNIEVSRPGTSRDDLRKALVLREVIDPPLSLRD